MIGCLILAFALCQVPAPGYYVQPVQPGYQPGYPVPVQQGYYAPPQVYYPPPPVYYAPAPAYGYGGVPVALNFRFGGWGGGGYHGYGGWHR